MTVSASFKAFLDNIKVSTKRAEKISNRYREITKKLNQRFRETDSESTYCLQVGSYGRYTGVKGISDLDMLYSISIVVLFSRCRLLCLLHSIKSYILPSPILLNCFCTC